MYHGRSYLKQQAKSECVFKNSSHGRSRRGNIQPTVEQAFKCMGLCQSLSNLYRNIQVFRYDDVTGLVFILAAENVEILMQRDGTWRFTGDEAEF